MARRDAGEFTSFVLRTQPALRRTAFLMGGDWAQASDHVQEAYIRVYRHWPRLRGRPRRGPTPARRCSAW
jgi:DNA-directed RNA polymerase specialized sigma24 family protein